MRKNFEIVSTINTQTDDTEFGSSSYQQIFELELEDRKNTDYIKSKITNLLPTSDLICKDRIGWVAAGCDYYIESIDSVKLVDILP